MRQQADHGGKKTLRGREMAMVQFLAGRAGRPRAAISPQPQSSPFFEEHSPQEMEALQALLGVEE
jgi:hypothetical protein